MQRIFARIRHTRMASRQCVDAYDWLNELVARSFDGTPCTRMASRQCGLVDAELNGSPCGMPSRTRDTYAASRRHIGLGAGKISVRCRNTACSCRIVERIRSPW